MATKPSTTTPADTSTSDAPDTPDTPDTPAPAADAVEVTHDRAITNVGSGRVTFKGHNAKAGYPFRVYEGRVEALVDGAWVEAEDAQAL